MSITITSVVMPSGPVDGSRRLDEAYDLHLHCDQNKPNQSASIRTLAKITHSRKSPNIPKPVSIMNHMKAAHTSHSIFYDPLYIIVARMPRPYSFPFISLTSALHCPHINLRE